MLDKVEEVIPEVAENLEFTPGAKLEYITPKS